MPFTKTIDLLEDIMQHVRSCSQFQNLRCVKDITSLNDNIICTCGHKWIFDEMQMEVESQTGYELLYLITRNQFYKGNPSIDKIINIYGDLDNQEISEIKNSNNKTGNIFDGIELD